MITTTALTLAAEAASTSTADSLSIGGIRDAFAAIALAGGLFFMFVGVLGILRLPDAYSRMHAASKCTTLGLTGMLIAAGLHLWTLDIVAKSIAVIVFTFVATPIGTHLLAKAAHHGKLPLWDRTLSDELAEDKADPNMAATDDEIGIPCVDTPCDSSPNRLRMSA
ncbi:MAG: monovalent cation/H(+) antiporter subunit G [Phycisphaerales bacterium JB065]